MGARSPRGLCFTHTGDMVPGTTGQWGGTGGARLRKPHSKPSTAGWEEPFRDAPGFRGRLSAQITARWLTWAPPRPEPLGAWDLLHSRAGGSGLALPGPRPGLWLGHPHVGESGFSPHCEGRGLPTRDVPSDLAVTWVPTPDVHTHSCLHTSTHSFTCTQSPTLQHTCSCPYTCTHLTFTPPHSHRQVHRHPCVSIHTTHLGPTLSHTFTRTHRFTVSQGRTLAHTPTLMPPRSHVSTHVCTFTRTYVDVCGIHPHIHPHSRSHPVTLRPPAPNVRAHTPLPHPVHSHVHTLTCDTHTRSLTHTKGWH